MKRSMLLAAGILMPCLLGAGENLFYNSSFEMGLDGWDKGQLKFNYPYDPKMPPVREWVKSDDAPFGKHVMQITMDKKLFDPWLLASSDVKLIPGKKYTVSFYVKPEKDSKITYSLHSNHYGVWRSTASGKPFLKGGKWQRIHNTFVYKRKNKNHDAGYDTFFLLVMPPLNGLRYQFDGMQLEEGELTDYKPAAKVEYKLTTPNLYLKETDKITVSLSAYSYDKKTEASADLILQDTGKEKDLQKKNVKFNLAPGKMQTKEITFGELPYGGFRISVPGAARSAAVDFVRIHANDEVYKKGTFSVGIGTSSLGVFTSPYLDVTRTIVWQNKYEIDEGEGVRLSGSVVSSNFDGIFMSLGSLLPKARGEYFWKHYDLYYDRVRQLKVKTLESIATQVLMTKRGKRDMGQWTPEWLRKLDRSGHPDGQCNGSWKHVRTVLPPPEVIAECAEEIVKRYRDDICMFRLFGEANGYMKAPQLFEYSKATYAAVRKVDPDMLLNAFNATEDFGSVMGGYLDDFLKLGGGKYTDVISFHPYKSPQDDSALSAMAGIQSFKDIMKNYGVSLKLAETECFYLIQNPYNNQPEFTWTLFKPEAITRRCLIDIGEGLILSIPLEMSHLHQTWPGNRESYPTTFTKVPNAGFAAHNAAGYFLNGAVKNGKVKLPGTELCYTFEKNGKKFSAAWCITGKSNMTLDLPNGVSCRVYDLYGNLEKSASKTLKLVLDRRPQFIEWSGKADPAAIHAAGEYTPLQLIQFHGVQQMDGGIGILISNRSSKPVSGFLRLNSKYIETEKTKFEDMKPHSDNCIVVPAKIKPDAPKTFQLTAVCLTEGKFFSKKVSLKRNPVLKLGQENQLGPHRFTLEKKGDKLLFTGFLSSRAPKRAPDPDAPWGGDSIEIFCDFTPEKYNPNKTDAFNDSCIQFCIPAVESGSPVPMCLRSRRKIKLTDVKVIRSAEGAQVTAALPYRKGMHINFHFNAEGKTAIFNGTMNFKDRSGFAVVSE